MGFGYQLHTQYKNRLSVTFFLLLLIIGLYVYKDYGISIDEPIQRGIGTTSLVYLANIFNIGFLLDNKQPIADPASIFLTQRDRDYGVAFELPAEFLIKIWGLNDANAYLFRHLLTFLIFYVAVIFFYKLVRLRYSDWRVGLLGAIFLVLSPRIFGDSFFNDKDLVFMSIFLIGIYTLVCFILKPGALILIGHSFVSAIAIDLRLMAVLLPVVTIVTILALAIRKELPYTKAIGWISLYLTLTALMTLVFWPWLWTDPIGNFVTAFNNMAKFRHPSYMYFIGDVIPSNNLPWYYIPVWLSVTTPILYLILFVVGVAITLQIALTNLIGQSKAFWVNSGQLQDLLFLGLFIVPLAAVIFLDSVLYNGWRQMYFIYPAFLLVSIRGLVACWKLVVNLQTARRIFITIIVGCSLYTSFWMVRWHPYQYLYFNLFAGQYAKNFDVDYWAVAYRPILEKVIGQDEQKNYSIYANEVGETWGYWQYQYINNLLLLPYKDQQRIITDRSENCSDYIITVPIGNRKQYSEKKEFELFDELIVDGQIIYTTFKRKIPLYEYYNPAIGKQIEFSSGHTKCFLKSGWASNNEEWGVWSVGKEAKLALFMPKEHPRFLLLNVRSFVNSKVPTQEVEISINGENIQKTTLSNFDTNLIKVPIPTSAHNKEWLNIDIRLPGAISPRELGVAPDERPLGIGLKSALFE